MKEPKSQSMQALIIAAVALIALWVLWGLAAFLLVSGEPDGKAGLFGDAFGGFNALVSVLGFGAVLYSLQRQHEDAKDAQKEAKDAEKRHNDLFQQNVNLALLERRFEVYDATRELLLRSYSGKPTFEVPDNLSQALKHTQFLFPKESKLHEYTDRVLEYAIDMASIREREQRREQRNLPPDSLSNFDFNEKRRLRKWFWVHYRTGVHEAFQPYLSVSVVNKENLTPPAR